MFLSHPEIERPPPSAQCKHCKMCAKSVSTPSSFYEITGDTFDKDSIAIPEFRAGSRGNPMNLPPETVDAAPSMEIIPADVKDPINIGSVKQIYGLNWSFGDMYSSRPPRPTAAAPEPSSSSVNASTSSERFLEPINPVWPTGLPRGKQWRGTVFPYL